MRISLLASFLLLAVAASSQSIPKISALSADFAAPGATITITGTDFNSTVLNNVVFFGAARGTITGGSTTQLSVTVPAAAAYGPVSVVNTANGLTGYSPRNFMVSAGLVPGNLSFVNKKFFDAGSNTLKLALGDLNDDGRPDIVTVNQSSNTITILNNQSDPGPGAPSVAATPLTLTSGSGPSGVTIGDLNGDGKPDIVTANAGDTTVSVFINTGSNGSLSFSNGVSFRARDGASAVAIGDIDGDGKPDIVVGNTWYSGISILRNTISTAGGSASFATRFDIATGQGPTSLVLNDMDGDGKTDFVISNRGHGNVVVVRNLSTPGSLNFASVYEINEPTPGPVAVADIDMDGMPDIVFGKQTSNEAYVFRNTSTIGSLSFSATGSAFSLGAGTPVGITAVAFGDLNGDGKPDLSFTNASKTIFFAANTSTTGAISFGAVQAMVTPFNLGDVTILDVDRDGKPDLAGTTPDEGRVFVFRNTTSNIPPTITSVTPSVAAVGASITVTGTDFVDVTNFTFGLSQASVQVLSSTEMRVVVPNNTDADKLLTLSTAGGSITFTGFTQIDFPTLGSFAPVSASVGATITITGNNLAGTTQVYFGGMAAASFAVLSNTTITAVLGNGASGVLSVTTSGGTAALTGFTYLQLVPSITSFAPASGATGDVITITGANLTGATDVKLGGAAVASFNVLSSTTIVAVIGTGSSGTLSVTTAGGTAGLSGFTYYIASAAPKISSVSPLIARPGDVVTINGSLFNTDPSLNIVYFGATRAEVSSATASKLVVSVPVGATYDVVSVLNAGNGLTGYSPKPVIPNYGTVPMPVSFAAKVDFASGIKPFKIAVIDLNGDGKPDIVSANQTANTVSVFKNSSVPRSVSNSGTTSYATGSLPSGIAVGDLNGDGKPDIVTANYSGNTISVLANTGSAGAIAFAAKADFATGLSPYGVAIMDIDGDGKPDVVTTNSNANTISVLRNTTASAGGTISFAAKSDFGTLSYPISVVITDIDGDGKPDIAVAAQLGSAINLFRNTSLPGTFSFSTSTPVSAGTNPVALAIGDMNADGIPELFTARLNAGAFNYTPNTSTPGTISFSASGYLFPSNTHSSAPSIALADLDGDGRLDVSGISQADNIVFGIQNMGNLSYNASATIGITGSAPNDLKAADIDGDGKPDLIVPNSNANTISVIRNRSSNIAPTITSVAPLSAVVGQVITITGAELDEVISVSLGASNSASFQSLSSTTLRVTVGANAASGSITVTTAGGTVAITGFVVGIPPTVASFTPTSAVPGQTITVTGTSLSGALSVTLGGTAVTSFNVLSSTTLTLVVGTGTSGNLEVTTPFGTNAKNGFHLIAPPQISSFSPSTARAGEQVTISGNYLDAITAVSFGGTAALTFTASPSGTSALAVVGYGSTGSLSIVTLDGSVTKTGFVYDATPKITSVSPMVAYSGATVNISGVNFTGVTAVTIGGVGVASFNVLSSTAITGVVAAANLSGAVSVTTAAGIASVTGFEMIQYIQAIVTIAPQSGGVGASVVINGNNFHTTPSSNIVYFGATRATVVSGTSSQLTVTVPAGATYGAVSVFNSATGITSWSTVPFLPTFAGNGATVTFGPQTNAATGSSPFKTAVGDLDDDGKADLVAINQNSNSISVFRNISNQGADIGLASATTYLTGSMPADVLLYDMNGDGKKDIIVSNYGSGTVSVLLNTSTGSGNISFATKVDFSVGTSPYGILVADLDRNGRPDIISMNAGSNTISVLRNMTTSPGLMGFATRQDFATGNYPIAGCVIDFDNDGLLDIAVVNQLSGSVSFFRNTSVFQLISLNAKSDVSVGNGEPIGVTAIDYNSDGKQDLVVNKLNDANITLLVNATFSPTPAFGLRPAISITQSYPINTAAGDMDGDGLPDITLPHYSNSAISIMKNTGSFSSGNRLSFGIVGSNPRGILNADLNGDGRPEMIVALQGSNQIAVLRNTTNSGNVTVSSFTPMTAKAGDTITVTGTGFVDIQSVTLGGTAAASFQVLSSTTMRVTVANGTTGSLTVTAAGGVGALTGFTYLSAPTITSFTPSTAGPGETISIAGTNLSGAFSVTFGGTPATAINVVSPTLVTAVLGAGSTGSIVIATPGGTGTATGFKMRGLAPVITEIIPALPRRDDMITIKGRNFKADPYANQVIFAGKPLTLGSISMATTTEIKIRITQGIDYGPVGILDPATGQAGESVGSLAVVNPIQSELKAKDFYPQKTIATDGFYSAVATGEFNSDQRMDIVACYAESFSGAGVNKLVFYKNLHNGNASQGTARFERSFAMNSGQVYSIKPFDVDGDGKQDIVCLAGSGTIEIYRNLGSSSNQLISFATTPLVLSFPTALPGVMSIRDIDGDGLLDIVAGASTSNVFKVYRNLSSVGNIAFAAPVSIPTSGQMESIAINDVDGDGKFDVVIGMRSSANGSIAVHRNSSQAGSVSFDDAVLFPAANIVVVSLSVNDIDNDNKPDIVLRDITGVKVLRNVYSGGTLNSSSFVLDETSVGPFGSNISMADMDTDGKPDVVMTTGSPTGKMLIRKNISTTGAGGTADFTTLGVIELPESNNSQYAYNAISDLDDDGRPDVVIASSKEYGSMEAKLSIVYSKSPVPPPFISNMSPAIAGPGSTINILGTNLSGILTATFGGVPAAAIIPNASNPDMMAQIVVGQGASGTLTVTTEGGSYGVKGFEYIPPVVIKTDSVLCSNSNKVYLSANNVANALKKMQWYLNDTLIPGATTASYVGTATGSYKMTLTAGNLSYTSNVLTIVKNATPAASFELLSDSVQCLAGNLFKFRNTSTLASTTDSIASRKWTFMASGLSGSSLNDPSFTYTDSGKFIVKLVVASSSGCKDSVQRTVVVNPPPVLVINPPGGYCSSPGFSIDITKPSITEGSAAGLTLSYWNDKAATVAVTDPGTITQTGTYYVKAVNTSGCVSIKPLTIVIHESPVVMSITGPDVACQNTEIQLQNTVAGGVWSATRVGPTTIDQQGRVKELGLGPNVFIYSVTGANGCITQVTKTVTGVANPVASRPAITGFPADTVVCFPATIDLTSTNTYDSYLWSNGATTRTVTVSTNESITLKVGNNASGCTSPSSVVVTTHRNVTPPPVISRVADTLVSSASLSYRWLFNNRLTGDTTARYPVGARGVYNVSTTADRVCWNTSNDYLVILNPAPAKKTYDLSVYPNPTTGPFNAQVKFDNPTTAIVKLTLVDLAGNVKWTGRKLLFFDRSLKIPVNIALPAGVYTLQVDVNGEIKTQQIVIQ